ncbi:diguanylate cyclase [Noviherbaspirillum sp.]|uniref:diguanylate cyclase n=1 Tax=Noviherbaspirillum sp. TaxID=1926288 RepID=UPI002FE2D78E
MPASPCRRHRPISDTLRTAPCCIHIGNVTVRTHFKAWQWKTEYTIIVMMVLALPVLLLVGASTLRDVEAYIANERRIDALHGKLHRLDALFIALQDAETGQRGYLLTGDEHYLHPYHEAKARIGVMLGDLPAWFADDAATAARAAELRRLARAKLDELAQTIALQQGRTNADAALAVVRQGAGKAHMDAIREVIRQIRLDSDRRLAEELRASGNRWISTRHNAFLLLGMLTIFGGLTIWVSLRDLRLKRMHAERMAHEAQHDPLTRLPNRRFLDQLMPYMFACAKRDQHPLAVLFIDLDGFKQINDRFGHDAGDDVLREAARRFAATVRETDVIVRLGGDEFAVLMPKVRGYGQAKKLAVRMAESVSVPLLQQHGEARVSASIGIAVFPKDGETPEEILGVADRRMYEMKRAASRVEENMPALVRSGIETLQR